MKKLALLLGALSLVSSVAYAKEVVPAVEEVVVVEEVKAVEAPKLVVTSIGQYVEVDNTSGTQHGDAKGGEDIGEAVFFGNTVNFSYGEDWSFYLLAAKMWGMDTDDGIHGNNHRLELGVWRHFENGSLGFKWRGQSDYDRYYLRGKYSYGMFSGWADVAYQSNNAGEGSSDKWYSEGMPIAVTYGPVTLGYYYETNYMVGDLKNGDEEYDLAHQLRLMFPLYKGEKLTVGAEYRWQFAYDEEYKGNAPKEGWQDVTKHIAIVNASYAVSDSLTIDGYYRYDFRDYEGKDGATDWHEDYYGEFYAGWTYTF